MERDHGTGDLTGPTRHRPRPMLAGCPNRKGQRLLPMSGGLMVVYPAVCLAFIAFGIIMTVMNL